MNVKRILATLIVLSGVALGQAGPSVQIDATNATGIIPYSTRAGVRENIDLPSGAVHIDIPLLHLPGRAGHDLNLSLIYDSKVWVLDPYAQTMDGTDCYMGTGPTACQSGGTILGYDYIWEFGGNAESTAGWRLNIPKLASTTVYPYARNTSYQCKGAFVFTDEGGTAHTFGAPPNTSGAPRTDCMYYPSNSSPVSDSSLDISTGSSIGFPKYNIDLTNSNDWIVTDKHGTKYHFSGAQVTRVEDTNGNYISFSYSGAVVTIKDTIGRQLVYTPVTLPATTGTVTLTFTDSNGQSQTISWGIQPYNFSFTPQYGGTGGTSNPSWPAWLQLPNGGTYHFEYDSLGEISKITYPTGGYTRYSYASFPSDHYFAQAGQDVTADIREITAKYSCSSYSGSCASEDQTTYSPSITSSVVSNTASEIVGPAGKTDFTFAAANRELAFAPRELTRTVYNPSPSGAELRFIQTDYNNLNSTTGLPTSSSLPIRVTTTETDVSPSVASKTETDYGLSGSDNPTEIRQYDFSGNLLKRTDNTWLSATLDRLTGATIYDAGSNQAAKTTLEYDNYTQGLSASGAIQLNPSSLRANVTAVQKWRNTDGATLTTRFQYDDAGNIVQMQDANGNTTQYSWNDSWANTACVPSGGAAKAYLTQLTNAKSQTSTFTVNSCTGTRASALDPNHQTTTYTYDLMGRTKVITAADGGTVQYDYTDQAQVKVVRTDSVCSFNSPPTTTCSTSSKIATTLFDGLARPVQTQLNSAANVIYVDTTYDGADRVSTVSNPYFTTSDPTYGITRTSYDGLNRPLVVTRPDQSTVQTSYSGPSAMVTDESGRSRETAEDALGRLTDVYEPNPQTGQFDSGDIHTAYTYNLLGNLLSVTQSGPSGTLTRNFSYDSLSELITANNPESGNVCYGQWSGSNCTGGYDADGNLLYKTDARGVVTSYHYDALNRLADIGGLAAKTYSGTNSTASSIAASTPAVHLVYDAAGAGSGEGSIISNFSQTNLVGRLATEWTGSGGAGATARYLSYGSTGVLIGDAQCTPGTCNVTGAGFFKQTYEYYNDANPLSAFIATSTGGAGYKLVYTNDAAGRLVTLTSSLADTNHPATLASGIQYDPFGMSSMTLGNGIVESYSHNARGWVGSITAQKAGAAVTYSAAYSYAPNGNVTSQNDSVIGNWSNYSYDYLNRLTAATAASGVYGGATLSWSIDSFGNNKESGSGNSNVSITQPNYTFSGNRISTYCYDNSGNVLNTGSCTTPSYYSYDAEGRMVNANGSSYAYVYDAEDRRVSGPSGEYVYDASGRATTVISNSDHSWQSGYIFAMGKHLSDYTPTTSSFIHEDMLGSERVKTDLTGNTLCSTATLPYGDGTVTSGTCPGGDKRLFTGKERDSETGLDYFGARYYDGSSGRWTSPDVVNLTDERIVSPANTLNKYAYGAENPLKFTDPDGRDITLFYDQSGPAGHIVLLAYNQLTGNSAVESFGPASHGIGTRVEELLNIPVPGRDNYGFDNVTSADQIRGQFTGITIRTSPEEAQAAIQFIRSHPAGKYTTYWNSCASTCSRILAEIGRLPYWRGTHELGLRPSALWYSMYFRYGDPSRSDAAVAPRNGVDYGQPRQGYDAFDALYRAIQRQMHEQVTHKVCWNESGKTVCE